MTARVRWPRGRRSATLRTAVPLVTLVLASTACGEQAVHVGAGDSRPPATSPGTDSTRTASPRTTSPLPGLSSPTGAASSDPGAAPAAPAATCTDRYFSGMTTAQRVGQLFMGGVSAARPDQAQLRTLRTYHVGSIMLTGRSTAGVTATRRVVDGIRGQADQVAGQRVGLLVSTDQEGGRVQVLSGPGFSTIPSGLTQGSWSTTTLRTRAAGWAEQLKAAGLNLNLAPVADVVPASLGTRNRPIGYYYREYGHTAATVASHSNAFAAGFAQSGVMTTLKHFPGLGQVLGNTDTTANVVDSVTTTRSSSLTPFRDGIRAGSPFVMVSLATYTKIDSKHLAAFSPTVINQVLRTQLGFKGVVISDDIGNAVAVRAFTPAQRAVNFITAGGNMILTVNPSTVPAMASAIQARMQQDASFRAKVNASVHRILDAKAKAGLLTCR
ncbi:glycoside hydrolase family 3 N-terminal domain-containing protein [Streptomyces chiangmaiensis]|uniref:Glycoside hydrolase family 3 N-terminal domain-containing protein n=1 Tax=Streptomyces chiangmaiensis TaxID=766497 RepID=A0ABU7FR47_9ACTN|nr:glycoside hydrolase family 3 N-terminal domain-containing protein [Streptomyces chiangmaiensis]MED7826592.1 glycoside hydrolase family 3 N-terminal domain-containing protein [Streptomyces chiangmaiensis]